MSARAKALRELYERISPEHRIGEEMATNATATEHGVAVLRDNARAARLVDSTRAAVEAEIVAWLRREADSTEYNLDFRGQTLIEYLIRQINRGKHRR